MMTTILTAMLYGGLVAYEFPRLKKKQEKKEWFIFLVLMLAGFILSLLIANHISFKDAPKG